MNKKIQKLSDKFKALSNPIRVSILLCLLNGQSNVTKIQECLNIPQSTVSKHLGILKNAGVIEGERSGLEVIYSIVDDNVKG
ncbi:metalloregulator ArsR/SmtB family transcription factor [Caloramator sp. mosi_1]|uniref:ArsR/SmtB family transcription factor n=1 Tax=Caloramator sp. mosi_1 TaxID=3023090 RepID=UPI00236090D4|nr:metalloregulator ArsR/SmtB family transcription factor [Caloramator sp. mosi_1]WDC84431.1 metalloregulator ArsR/SmtB family transcription factor [Caloramator sp. mosi_1]